MISFIETTNFKKLDTVRVDFTDNTNLIVGDNGAGKTTIFNAIRFALYGSGATASPKENLPTWGHKNCEVKVGFANDFLIVRSLSDCKVYKAADDGQLLESSELQVAEGNSPCTKWVKDHIGLDKDMFDIFNMSVQGETGALITLGATKLNQTVENFSGVGILDKIIKSLSKDCSELNGALSALSYTPTEDLQVQFESAYQDNVKAQENVSKLQTAVDIALEAFKTASEEFNQANLSNRLSEEMRTNKATIKGRLEQFNSVAKSLDSEYQELSDKLDLVDIEAYRASLTTCLAKIDEFNIDSNHHTNCETAVEKYAADVTRYTEMVERKKEVEEQKQRLNKKLDACDQEVSVYREKLSACEKETAEAQEYLRGGVCPKCKRAFENFDPEKAKAELDKAEEAEANAKEAYIVEVKRYKLIKSQLASLEDIPAEVANWLSEAKSDLEYNQGQIKVLEDKWEDFDEDGVNDDIKAINKVIDSYTSISGRMEDLKRRVYSSRKEMKEIENQLSQIGDIPDTIDTEPLQTKLTELEEKYSDANQDLSDKRVVQAKIAGRVQATKTELDSARAGNEQYEHTQSELDKSKRLMKFLRDTRTEYMSGVWQLILGSASKFVNLATDGWITQIDRNGNGDFTFTEDGVVATVKGEASGAQKEFIGVALRIGLGMALQGERALLMLDEPTAGMKEENADKLASGLLSASGQKIVITHRQSERLTAANIINL